MRVLSRARLYCVVDSKDRVTWSYRTASYTYENDWCIASFAIRGEGTSKNLGFISARNFGRWSFLKQIFLFEEALARAGRLLPAAELVPHIPHRVCRIRGPAGISWPKSPLRPRRGGSGRCSARALEMGVTATDPGGRLW
jgi:hypothetical protein